MTAHAQLQARPTGEGEGVEGRGGLHACRPAKAHSKMIYPPSTQLYGTTSAPGRRRCAAHQPGGCVPSPNVTRFLLSPHTPTHTRTHTHMRARAPFPVVLLQRKYVCFPLCFRFAVFGSEAPLGCACLVHATPLRPLYSAAPRQHHVSTKSAPRQPLYSAATARLTADVTCRCRRRRRRRR